MSRKWIITIVIAAVIAVAAVVGVIVGVTTHTEEGPLMVCWVGGVAVYADAGENLPDLVSTTGERGAGVAQCENPGPLLWKRDRIPLRVVSVEANQGTNRPDLVKRAVQHVNSQVRFKLLEFTEQGRRSDIEVRWGVAQASGDAPATCSHTGEGGFANGALVKMGNTGGDRVTWKALLHELGHGVGLGHDDFEASIMYWEAQDDTWEAMRLDRFTDFDTAWLRSEYASTN